jgi:glycosyltransferase involved in cell wall biosynthesis
MTEQARDGVLHVVTSTQRRGAENFAVDLAAAMGARGVPSNVVALTAGAGGDTLPVAALGPRPFALHTLRALRDRARPAALVVAHGSRTLPACALALAGTRVPFVYRSIGDPHAWAGGRLRRLRSRALLSRAGAVVALWPAAADAVRALYGVPTRVLHVIPNGVPAERCPPPDDGARAAARRRFGLPDDAPVVAVVGALAPEKRVGDAIAAVAALDGVHLLVAGDGPERNGLGRRADEAAPGRVRFAGTLPGPGDALAAADVVALPSRTEGMPGVLIEAGLAGVAVVATDVGGVGAVVRDGQTGVLVAPEDVPGLAAGITRALGERERLGRAARERCLAEFEIGPVAERWITLTRGLAAPGRLP